MTGQPAIFIDKDGTLIENVPYNVDPEKLRFYAAAPEALLALSDAGYALVMVTNQSAIERGYFSTAQFEHLQTELEKRLAQKGVILTDFLFCPHAPDPNEMPTCQCRKPAPGMLIQAARRHHLDLSRSWMIGDTLDDIEAGHRAGCRSLFFDSGGETVWRKSPMRTPDAVCSRWEEVVHTVLGKPLSWVAPTQAIELSSSLPP
jgi:D-glycero-D-manno-heptose 1,7-bisphosphate phosphatase